MTKKEQRFRLVSDDSGHTYAIPADMREKFESWCLSFEDENEKYDGPDFEEFRLGMHESDYTFTDLQED